MSAVQILTLAQLVQMGTHSQQVDSVILKAALLELTLQVLLVKNVTASASNARKEENAPCAPMAIISQILNASTVELTVEPAIKTNNAPMSTTLKLPALKANSEILSTCASTVPSGASIVVKHRPVSFAKMATTKINLEPATNVLDVPHAQKEEFAQAHLLPTTLLLLVLADMGDI